MYRNIIVIMVVAIAFLSISINAVAADSTKLNVKPVSPASKIKAPASIAVPSPAPAPVVEPTPTKSVPEVAPKPKPSLTTTPKPVKILPKPQQVSPTPTPSKSPAVSSLPKVKPTGPTTSLPQGVQQNKLPAIQPPKDLGKSTNIPGSAVRDLSKTNSIGNKVTGETPTGGFSSRGPGAGLATGIGGRGSVGKYDRSAISAPVQRIGSGEHIQGQDPGEQTDQKPEVITFTEEETRGDADWSNVWEANKDYPWTEEEIVEEADEWAKPHPDDPDYHTESTESKPPPGFDTSEEKLADDGPTGGNLNGNNIDRDRVIGIFEITGGGYDFAPGEEQSTGGTVNPELLQTIKSNQTQVKTVDGINPNSNNIQDVLNLNKTEAGQPGVNVIDDTR